MQLYHYNNESRAAKPCFLNIKIMCLFPRYIRNKRYYSYISKKPNKGTSTAKPCDDYRKLYVPIGCGECIECRRQKAQQWRVRLCEELKEQKHAYFITLTFSNESLQEIMKDFNTNDPNTTATAAVRRFLERYRKKNKKSLRHWLITELGHTNTERIHLHGIIFPQNEITNDELFAYWKYGRTDIGKYCNQQTINYIVKYVTKIDADHKGYKPVILCSAGLGANYVHTHEAQTKYKYIKGQTHEDYLLNNGQKVALPIYYRNKLFTQNERDAMWTDRLDKGEIFVNGIRIRNIESDESQKYYFRLLKDLQEWNNNLGYGNTSADWQKKQYSITFKMLQRAKPSALALA